MHKLKLTGTDGWSIFFFECEVHLFQLPLNNNTTFWPTGVTWGQTTFPEDVRANVLLLCPLWKDGFPFLWEFLRNGVSYS